MWVKFKKTKMQRFVLTKHLSKGVCSVKIGSKCQIIETRSKGDTCNSFSAQYDYEHTQHFTSIFANPLQNSLLAIEFPDTEFFSKDQTAVLTFGIDIFSEGFQNDQ